EFERYITLQVLDSLWKEHLHLLDRLRESVSLRGYAQRDPLVEYKKEAFKLFEDMLFNLKKNTLEYLYKVDLVSEEELRKQEEELAKEAEKTLQQAQTNIKEETPKEKKKKVKKKKLIKYKNRFERRKHKNK
ncbi:MAG TPA: preprotein translocase subunit SecA, partial [Hydrogenothermaceae bacterium]|nr:preprotein translocase subunit SecA [Hydrogenothermaceae bacterium]